MKTSKADKYFSIFIRLRDSDENGYAKCCTCGKIMHWKKGDCGHYIKRQHQSTRFNETNAHFQCKKCNAFEQGASDKHKDYIIKRYGEQAHLLLESCKYKTTRRLPFELDVITNIYKKKAIEEAKKRGIIIK